MQGTRREIVSGWKESRWLVYFALILPLALAPTAVLVYLMEGKLTTPPAALAWALIGVAALTSLYWAGLWDGPAGKLGSYVWTLTLFAVTLWMVRRVSKEIERQKSAQPVTHTTRIGLAGHVIEVRLTGRRDNHVNLADLSDTIRRQLQQPTEGGVGRSVLIGI